MAVLFVALLWMLRTCAYRYRWLFGGTVSLFLLVLGSTVTQIQWDKINCDWSSEKKVYRGVVQETPVEKEKVMVCKVKTEDRQVLLSVYKDSLSQTLQSGDNILFYGKIRSPHNAGNPYEFDYASYLLRKQISGTAYVYAGYWRVMDKQRVLGIKQQALACRDKIVGCYRQWGFKGEEFAVLSALTVGYKEELSDELRESYSVAGISHVLALSGLHVGILWFLLGYMLRPFCRNRAMRILKWVVVTLLLWSFAFVASLQALGHEKKIRHVIRRTCENCFFFGAFCTFFFFIFGKSLGNFLFHSETAGIYIRTLAFICPFLYTNTALESILNGLGRPDTCLFHNIAGVCIRIGFVFFSIPVLGIRGYFYGMLLSQLILTLLHFIYLNRLERV